jgi:hypothetical protein
MGRNNLIGDLIAMSDLRRPAKDIFPPAADLLVSFGSRYPGC